MTVYVAVSTHVAFSLVNVNVVVTTLSVVSGMSPAAKRLEKYDIGLNSGKVGDSDVGVV